MTNVLFLVAALFGVVALWPWWRWRAARQPALAVGADVGTADPGAAPPDARRRAARRSAAFAGLALLALAGALSGPWFVGPDRAGGPTAGADEALTPSQAQALVQQWNARLQAQPADAQGWQTLAHALRVLKRYDEAASAYARAATLQPQDATLLADEAHALAMARQRRWEGEPLALLERARSLDPHNPKALALSGTAAFDRRDYSQALAHWELLARTQPPGSVYAKRVQPSIAEARRLGGRSSTGVVDAAASAAHTAPAAR